MSRRISRDGDLRSCSTQAHDAERTVPQRGGLAMPAKCLFSDTRPSSRRAPPCALQLFEDRHFAAKGFCYDFAATGACDRSNAWPAQIAGKLRTPPREGMRCSGSRDVPAKRHMMRRTCVSSGIAHGTAYVLACTERAPEPMRSVAATDVDGADREEENVANHYEPHHPGVLRQLKFLADTARAANPPRTIWGATAGDAGYTALLLGLGLRAFSVAADAMLEVKNAIRRTALADAVELPTKVLDLETAAEVQELPKARTPPRPV